MDIVLSKPKAKSFKLTSSSIFGHTEEKNEKLSSWKVDHMAMPKLTAHVSYTTVHGSFCSRVLLASRF